MLKVIHYVVCTLYSVLRTPIKILPVADRATNHISPSACLTGRHRSIDQSPLAPFSLVPLNLQGVSGCPASWLLVWGKTCRT